MLVNNNNNRNNTTRGITTSIWECMQVVVTEIFRCISQGSGGNVAGLHVKRFVLNEGERQGKLGCLSENVCISNQLYKLVLGGKMMITLQGKT